MGGGEGGWEKKDQAGNDAVEFDSRENNTMGIDANNNNGQSLLRDSYDDQRIANGEEGSEERRKGEEGNGEEEDEEYEEEEGEEDEEGEEREEEAVEEEKPTLEEGFYEVEAIRHKRVRKGQLQYLIKWRGWPETANTWEPSGNLETCSDIIDAFEESLQSGKNNRKRKRKYGVPHCQPKKKQPRSTPAAYDVTGVEISATDEPLSSPAPTQFMGSGQEGENNGHFYDVKIPNRVGENGTANGPIRVDDMTDDNEYDPKLSELRGTVFNNEVIVDKLGIHFQEGKASEGDGPTNGIPKVNRLERDQSRCTGAKRRKSGSVKRFKQEPASCEPVLPQNSTPSIIMGSVGTAAWLGTGHPGVSDSNLSHKPKTDDLTITRIIKPISFSASVLDNVQDASVTFMALRSDGKEVMVNNKFLKANNPLLLIDFYEQHLKFSPTLEI